MSQESNNQTSPLIVGIDWSDEKHDQAILDGKTIQHLQVDAEPNAIEPMIQQLTARAAGRPIAVCLEKGRVSILYHLIHREEFVLYPIDPKQAARYRESFTSSKAKDDRGDARCLARLLQERIEDMKPLRPDDPLTRRIAWFSEHRRSLVNEKTRLIQQLTAKIKLYHPLALMLPGKLAGPLGLEFVRRFPDPRKAQKAHKLTLEKLFRRHGTTNPERLAALIEQVRTTPIVTSDAALIEPLVILVRALIAQLTCLDKAIAQCEQETRVAMNQHPDAELFRELPGAGEALAPRLLALYGSDRERYENAEEVAKITGIAPGTTQSGKKRQVTRRRACPKFLLQTFHEFARCAAMYCPWSEAYYRWQRGGKHGEYYDGYMVDILMDADSEIITQMSTLEAGGDEAKDAVNLIRGEQAAHGNSIESLSIDGAGFNGEMLQTLEGPADSTSEPSEGLDVKVFVPPKSEPSSDRFTGSDFTANEDGSSVTCPQGETSQYRQRDPKRNATIYRFTPMW